MIQTHLHPPALEYISQATTLVRDNDMNTLADDGYKTERKELRCLFAVIRHGDRTPKEKVKVKVSHPKMLAMFDGREPKQIRLRSDAEISAFVEVIREMVAELRAKTVRPPLSFGTASLPSSPAASKSSNGGSVPVFQPVALPHPGMASASTSGATTTGAGGRPQTAATCESDGQAELLKKLEMIELAFEDQDQITALSRKVQLRPTKFSTGEDGTIAVRQVLVIVKYGGQLTDFGFKQADLLGKYYHQYLYPPDTSSNLSLHSSFAHDIKFYASDEGRVQMTAAMFAKAFLELDEEEIIPILYALVWNDDRAISWLDCSISSSSTFTNEKRRVADVLNADVDFGERNRALDPTLLFGGTTVEELRRIGAGALGNPRRQLERVRASIVRLLAELEPRCCRSDSVGSTPDSSTISSNIINTSSSPPPHSCAEPPCTPDDVLLAGGARAAVAEGCDDATVEAAVAAEATLAEAAAAIGGVPSGGVAVPKPSGGEESGSNNSSNSNSSTGPTLSCSPRSASKAVVQYDSQVARAVSVWKKLLRVLYSAESGRYDVSKVPDVLDCALYHMLHFRTMSPRFREVYAAVYPLAAWVVPHEYGISQGSKNAIAEAVVRPLVNKLLADLRQPREQRQLQTVSRFYFTSESHLNTLYNMLEYRLGRRIAGPRYEEYISHFVVKMFENTWIPVNDPRRFVVEVWHSPGSNAANIPDPPGNMHTFVQPLRPYITNMTLDDFIKALE